MDGIPSARSSRQVPAGVIWLWAGAIVNIPPGWQLCDGTNGTPNLRDRFVVGAGTTYAVDANGGNIIHGHGDNFAVGDPSGTVAVAAGVEEDVPDEMHTHLLGGSVTNVATLPPYYALAYIMKL